MIEKMVYTPDRCKPKILARDWYKGYEYLCISYGIHPCAYVAVAEGQPYYDAKNYDDAWALPCHGGCTFVNKGYDNIISEDFTVLGWDYAHAGDFAGYYMRSPNLHEWNRDSKKWTTKELIRDCEHVIEHLYLLENQQLFYK